MSFKEWLSQIEAFDQKRAYKKRRPGAITGAAKLARRGGFAVVKPANLSKPPKSSVANLSMQGITIGGLIFGQAPKNMFKKKRYF